jgi:WD40 repeat protein
MINTNDSLTLIIEVESGELVGKLQGYKNNDENLTINCCFTPKMSHIISGSDGSRLNVWKINKTNGYNFEKIFVLEFEKQKIMEKVEFNSKMRCFAVAGDKNISIWIQK